MGIQYEIGTWQPCSRTPRQGPEADLVDRVLAAHGWNGSNPLVFREPQLPTGFPDIVAVFPRKHTVGISRQTFELTDRHLRVLHHVHTVQKTSVAQLSLDLNLRPRALLTVLLTLEAADLISRSSDLVRARPIRETFAARKIVAIEAKISNWKAVIEQATKNTWFASHSYALLPESRCKEVVRLMAARMGVGVISFDGTRATVLVRAQPQRLPVSFGSWVVCNWALRQLTVTPA